MTTTVNTPVNVSEVLSALEAFINRRPALDWRDYGADENGRAAYRSELRSISKDKKRALAALDEAKGLNPAKPDLLADSFRAFSGRLEWQPTETRTHHNSETGETRQVEWTGKLSYTAGQYFPTEYRKAAASVLETYVSAWKQWYASEHPVTFEYRTISDVRAANQSIGNDWFDRSSMRFFNTKIESGAVAIHDEAGRPTRARFITSERMDENHTRRYSIREAQPDGTIDTVGEFQGYSTRDAARASLLKERAL